MFFLTKFFPDDPLLLVFQKCLAKNPEDKKHDDKTQFSAIAPPLGGAILFFFGYLEFLFLTKVAKTSRNQKNTKKTTTLQTPRQE